MKNKTIRFAVIAAFSTVSWLFATFAPVMKGLKMVDFLQGFFGSIAVVAFIAFIRYSSISAKQKDTTAARL